jgi:hypothetical protein
MTTLEFELSSMMQKLHRGMRIRVRGDDGVDEYFIVVRKRLNKVWVVKDTKRNHKAVNEDIK